MTKIGQMIFDQGLEKGTERGIEQGIEQGEEKKAIKVVYNLFRLEWQLRK